MHGKAIHVFRISLECKNIYGVVKIKARRLCQGCSHEVNNSAAVFLPLCQQQSLLKHCQTHKCQQMWQRPIS